jgi:hypothetical protein
MLFARLLLGPFEFLVNEKGDLETARRFSGQSPRRAVILGGFAGCADVGVETMSRWGQV